MTKITKKWAVATAAVLQHSAEGLLNTKENGLSDLIAAKSGAAVTGISLMAIAKAFGTASTGTAISTLSGAAARGAMIKWFGLGSTFMGATFVVPLLVAGGGWLGWLLIKGAQRKPEDLTKKERALFHRCWGFSAVMKNKASGKVSELRLSPQEVGELRTLGADMEKYLRHGCRNKFVRRRTEKNLKELTDLLGTL